jgi:hypothetical protein
VVETHKGGPFQADMTISDYQDRAQAAYGLRYFAELKLSPKNVLTPENCGQVLDYFNRAHEFQPHRTEFAAILSNFDSTCIFTARYTKDTTNITTSPAPTLVDAIVYADGQSRLQYTELIPLLDPRFSSNWTVLAVARSHFLLSVPMPKPASVTPTSASTTRTGSTVATAGTDAVWLPPSQRRGKKDQAFVLKIAHSRTNATNEIAMLQKIRDSHMCVHVPELV